MTTFQKLKHEARRAEQRSDWEKAIDLYQRALDADEDMADLSLYNRIGDLHLRLGGNEAAVEYYERAVERYADNAMHTSAIALCNKILRIAPGRASIYRRLALLHARTGLVAEGRGSMMAYVRHVLADGEPEDAALAVAEFAEITKDDEICLQYAAELTERGETTAAVAQLRAAARLRTDRGDDATEVHERIAELDPDGTASTGAPSGATKRAEPESRKPPARLASLVARQLADHGNAAAFATDAPPAPVLEAPVDPDLAEVRVQADRFRSRVADVLETGDPTIRYDLGVEFMTIGLLEEAIGEFRIAVADPRLLEAANARIGECLALRGSEASFEALRRASRAALGRGAPHGTGTDAGAAVKAEAPAAVEPAVTPESIEAPDVVEAVEPEMTPESIEAPDAPEVVEQHETEPRAAEADDAAVPPMPDDRKVEAEEDALQGHLFRARLAQYRIRRAEERHRVDHAAHLDLGAAYIEMELHHEALRELGVALEGPRPIPGRAVRALRELALRLGEAPDLALAVIEQLADSGQGPAAEALGRELAEAWGEDHRVADRLAELRARLGGSVDELPALEDMFPALRYPAGDAAAQALDFGGDGLDASAAEEVEPPVVADEEAGPSTDRMLVRAADLVGAGDVAGALEHLQACLDRLDAGHRTGEALVVLARLLELQPDDAALHEHRTELAMMVDDRDELLAAFAGLGACLRRLGDAKRARAAYGRMLDVDPANELARQAIARIDEAEVALEQAARERDKSPNGTTDPAPSDEDDQELEAMYDFLDGLEEAELEIVPDDTEEATMPEGSEARSEDVTTRSRYELGLAFRQMGMWDEALRELRPAIGRVTDRLGVLEAVGECLVRLDRPEEAITLLREKLRSDEDAEQVGPLYFLGLALQAEGEHAEAREVLRRVEAVQPGYRDTADRLSELSH